MKLCPLVLALGLLPLVGCGSSSSSTTEKSIYSVRAVDGYLNNALVWLDINGDCQLDESTEPYARSDKEGIAELDVSNTPDPENYSVVVSAIAGETIDSDSINDAHPDGVAITTSFLMLAPAGQTVVTPLSTLVSIKMHNDTEMTLDVATDAVASELDIEKAILLDDYIASEQGDVASKANAIVALAVLPASEVELEAMMGDSSTLDAELQPNLAMVQDLTEDDRLVNNDGELIVTENKDSDSDGVLDAFDTFPNDVTETKDSDEDGVGDNSDVFPDDATESLDSDEDGVGDNSDVFPDDATESLDSDEDGVGDNSDVFPDDATESLDSDEDGVGDNSDVFPNDAAESLDSDEDGVGDNSDVFPNDATESLDSDKDSVGDNSDAFPNDATETVDSDEDGVGDNSDAFPDDATETVDSDEDGVGDNSDAFPDDATETKDSDGDGIGDNSDDDKPVFPTEFTLDMVSGQTLYTSDFFELVFTDQNVVGNALLNPEESSPDVEPYTISDGKLILGSVEFTLISADEISYTVEMINSETNETETLILYTSKVAFESTLLDNVTVSRTIIDSSDDSLDPQERAGFELQSLTVIKQSDELVITLKAEGDIATALDTRSSEGYGNFLWIEINKYLEFGMMNDGGVWLSQDMWQDGDYIGGSGVPDSDYSYTISGDTIVLTVATDLIPDNEYLQVSGTVAGDGAEDTTNYDQVTLASKWASNAFKTAMTDATFDSYTAGDALDTENTDYATYGVNGTTSLALISDDFANSGNNSLYLEDSSTEGKPVVSRAFADGAAESGSVSVSVLIPTDGYDKSTYIYLGTSDSTSSSKRFTEIVFGSSSVKFRHADGDTKTKLHSYERDTWVDVTIAWQGTAITLTVDGSVYTTYEDDAGVVYDMVAENDTGSPTLVALYVGNSDGANTYSYFDDLTSDLFTTTIITDERLLGSWYGAEPDTADNVTVTFYANGYYAMAHDSALAGDGCDDSGCPGMERGTYSWNASTGEFHSSAISDTNGEWGFSDLNDDEDLSLTLSDNTFSLVVPTEGTYVLTKVDDIEGSLVGAWYSGDSSTTDNITVTFFDNGYYTMAHDSELPGDGCDDSGCAGMERGTYSWNESTGEFHSSAISDTNGEWGFSNLNDDEDLSVTLSDNTFSLVIPGEGTVVFTRVID